MLTQSDTPSQREIRILIVEDVPSDAELAERELRKANILFCSKRVDTKEDFLKEISAEFEGKTLNFSDKKYRLIGVPFYNNEDENAFKEHLDAALHSPTT